MLKLVRYTYKYSIKYYLSKIFKNNLNFNQTYIVTINRIILIRLQVRIQTPCYDFSYLHDNQLTKQRNYKLTHTVKATGGEYKIKRRNQYTMPKYIYKTFPFQNRHYN